MRVLREGGLVVLFTYVLHLSCPLQISAFQFGDHSRSVSRDVTPFAVVGNILEVNRGFFTFCFLTDCRHVVCRAALMSLIMPVIELLV